MRLPISLLAVLALVGGAIGSTPARAEKLTIAAAADLKFAMDEIVASFKKANTGHEIEVIYGSSGKFSTQIQAGAPFDIYFSADIAYPRDLAEKKLTASEVKTYAFGRIVLWSATMDASKMTLADLGDPKLTRIAIANPAHAPYGQRAVEALQASGMWEKVEPRLVYGENISQTAQFILTGNSQIGVIALSLAVSPELASKGGYWMIPDDLHKPLEQGFVITLRAKDNPLARQFAEFMGGRTARDLLSKYGFVVPEEDNNSGR